MRPRTTMALLGATALLTGCGAPVREAAPSPTPLATVLAHATSPTPSIPSSPSNPSNPSDSSDPSNPSGPSAPSAPSSLNLDLPFYAQAPDADWSMPWQEACEEASALLIANAYFDHQWSRAAFKDEIQKLVDWEIARFGAYEHTDAVQTAILLKEALGLESRELVDPSFEDAQRALRDGHLLLGLFAGRALGNPYYSGEGPLYHAMVLKGFTADGKIVTHDVGTKRGADYVYPWRTLRSALHEWAEPIDTGRAVLLEVLPPAR